jgi:hypothetical protein
MSTPLRALALLVPLAACGSAAPAPAPTHPIANTTTAPSEAPRPEPATVHFGPFTAVVPSGLRTTHSADDSVSFEGAGRSVAVLTAERGEQVSADKCVSYAFGYGSGYLSELVGQRMDLATDHADIRSLPGGGCSIVAPFGSAALVVAVIPAGDATAIATCIPDPAGDAESEAGACGALIKSIKR